MDIILVCRKLEPKHQHRPVAMAIKSAHAQLVRLEAAGFTLSRNDRKIVFIGQLLTTGAIQEAQGIARLVEVELTALEIQDGPLVQKR